MSIKEIQNQPIFKADRNRIYNEALGLAKNFDSKVKSVKPTSHSLDIQVIEFRVHYVTSVRFKSLDFL